MKLFSGLKLEVLTLFFLNPGTSFHVREIARRVGKSARGVLYDLNSLEHDGILGSTRVGNMRLFKLKKTFPGREHLKQLLISVFGLPVQIKNEFANNKDIEDLFIYGSYADGTFDASSDLDLFVIGNAEYEELLSKIKMLEDRLSLEINPQIMTQKEYLDRKKKKDPYILDIEKKKRIYLIHEGKEV